MDYLDIMFRDVPFNKTIRFNKIEYPALPSGFKPGVGELKWGSIGQYRRGLLHAYDMKSHWLIHKDHFNPETHPVEHLLVDSPHTLLLGALVIGGIMAMLSGDDGN
ncbi:MAG: hypothetical protein ACFFER_12495 [Candidatus Thorarchaeota archaeon]